MHKNNLNITIASDPKEELMQRHNGKILKNKLKNDVINFDDLELYFKDSIKNTSSWISEYICKNDKTELFDFFLNTDFENYVYSSTWSQGQSEEVLDNKLVYLNRTHVYKKIIKSIGNKWKDKTIIDFGAGKGIHSWLLADLFKEVVSVEVLGEDLYLALQIHERLGLRSNVKFYLGDITTCYDEIIIKHRPDFLMFQIGYGFFHIKDKYDAGKVVISESCDFAKSISDKYQIPFHYQ